MKKITLQPHSLTNADRIFTLTSAPEIKESLGLQVNTVHDTIDFLQAVMAEELEGKTVSRAIINEDGKLIGITTLMFIDRENGSCSLGTWIGHEYWGQGYNRASKYAILQTAFAELGLNRVFIGARLVNKRSQAAQKKLPFITCSVEADYPDIHAALEKKEGQPCLLNVVYQADFPLVRPANTEDIPAVQAVARAAWYDTYEEIIPRPVQNAFLDHAYAVNQLKERFQSLFFVAECGGQVVGFANAVQEGPNASLQAVYLHPDAPRQEIGTRLLHEMINHFSKPCTITADVESGNVSGEQFYETNGFSFVEEYEENFLGHTWHTKRMQRKCGQIKKGVSL
ncbi:GNAT family N-acetyltransferase [Domibacillus sp. PGB-M46]|uniref:GNAT family N-acetyltransferase n=1 Tax=Domibacillus sp. PGB-M46 TaxID=2910255 RepID=UPI001F56911A|nr:GNAT family N-acetyltransferase [Domibacillus sp. PGB-M46]MCI2252830.1 GNAT family N-acetyltransferase [Domibacillus sp. PGB-M46]